MDQRQQQMLEEAVRLAEENNAMLRKLIWAGRRAWIIQVVKLVALIGIILFVYSIVQPYLSTIQSLYSGQDINKILDAYNASQNK